MFVTLNYHISATFRTILKINFRNFAKNFVSFNIKLVFNSFKIKNYFSYKDPILDDPILATLAELVVILKLGLRNISKRITSLIF